MENHRGETEENGYDHDEEHDPHFEPIIQLPEVHIASLEEDEDTLCRLRAKLFRYDKSEEPHQWKERGTGDIKILCHVSRKKARVLMRRDKTWKICANHYITQAMELKAHCGSDRAWLWTVPADFADEVPTPELLAVRFANADNANQFKKAFEAAQKMLSDGPRDVEESSDEESEEESTDDESESENEGKSESKETGEAHEVAAKLEDLKVEDALKSEN